jgi:hypothetical protein
MCISFAICTTRFDIQREFDTLIMKHSTTAKAGNMAFRSLRIAALISCACFATLTCTPAAAQRYYRGRVGVYVGVPLYAPYYYPPYYYPPYYADPELAYGVPAAPTVYVERSDAPPAASSAQGSSWYYCPDSQSYYPYVKECASPWQPVAPQPRSASK